MGGYAGLDWGGKYMAFTSTKQWDIKTVAALCDRLAYWSDQILNWDSSCQTTRQHMVGEFNRYADELHIPFISFDFEEEC